MAGGVFDDGDFQQTGTPVSQGGELLGDSLAISGVIAPIFQLHSTVVAYAAGTGVRDATGQLHFVSVRDVPVGIELTNTVYWEELGEVTAAEIASAVETYLQANPPQDVRLFIQTETPSTSSPDGSIWINTNTYALSILENGIWTEFASGRTGTEIITEINADGTTGRISAEHTTVAAIENSTEGGNARVTLNNGDPTTTNTFTNYVGGVGIAVTQNSNNIVFNAETIHHPQLRVSASATPAPIIRTTASNPATLTFTAISRIEDAGAGDAVHSTTITAAHSSFNNSNINLSGGNANQFTWSYQTDIAVMTLTFTATVQVDYTIGGIRRTSNSTEVVNVTVREPAQSYYYGTLSQLHFDNRATLTASAITTALTNTNTDIAYPISLDYTGSSSATYAALFAPADAGTVTSVFSEGFRLTFVSETVDNSGVSFALYIVDDPVSEGTHTIQWRA